MIQNSVKERCKELCGAPFVAFLEHERPERRDINENYDTGHGKRTGDRVL